MIISSLRSCCSNFLISRQRLLLFVEFVPGWRFFFQQHEVRPRYAICTPKTNRLRTKLSKRAGTWNLNLISARSSPDYEGRVWQLGRLTWFIGMVNWGNVSSFYQFRLIVPSAIRSLPKGSMYSRSKDKILIGGKSFRFLSLFSIETILNTRSV